jgi:hypothetical protein
VKSNQGGQTMPKTNISNFIAYCETELDLHQKLVIEKKTDPNETFYQSLPLCIIDAVFSIGVKYTSVMKAEENFISYFNLNIDRTYPLKNKEYTIDQFIKDMETFSSFDGAALNGFKNKQRTSSRNGILKAEACYLVAKVFKSHDINTLEDFRNYTNKPALDKDILKVRGQSSGIMLKYLYMLAGDSKEAKPDRHMANFIRGIYPHISMATKHHDEIKTIMKDAVASLQTTYPNLTVRFLDYLIWEHMKNKSQNKKTKRSHP